MAVFEIHNGWRVVATGDGFEMRHDGVAPVRVNSLLDGVAILIGLAVHEANRLPHGLAEVVKMREAARSMSWRRVTSPVPGVHMVEHMGGEWVALAECFPDPPPLQSGLYVICLKSASKDAGILLRSMIRGSGCVHASGGVVSFRDGRLYVARRS